jgi:uncharacterized protein YbjT (DUF2867 family)
LVKQNIDMHQTAIVFGATGLVGKELIFELLESIQYAKVTAIVRNTLPLAHPKLEQMIIKDFYKLNDHAQQFSADCFFCCIGTTIKTAGSKEAFRKVDLDIPVRIATIAETIRVPNLIIVSSIGANAQSSNFYLKTKGEMEQMVKAIYHGNLKFARPSFLIGNRGEFRFGEKVAKVMNAIFGIFMLGPLAKYRGIRSWDVARSLVKLPELPKEKILIQSDELQQLSGKNRNAKAPIFPTI